MRQTDKLLKERGKDWVDYNPCVNFPLNVCCYVLHVSVVFPFSTQLLINLPFFFFFLNLFALVPSVLHSIPSVLFFFQEEENVYFCMRIFFAGGKKTPEVNTTLEIQPLLDSFPLHFCHALHALSTQSF